MCAYKLVECEFKWWGLQSTVESRIMKVYPRLFRNFHREVFTWIDEWYGLTMDDIRKIEDKTKEELDTVSLSTVAKYDLLSKSSLKLDILLQTSQVTAVQPWLGAQNGAKQLSVVL